MTALEVSPDTVPEELAWGYTMADVERIAGIAARKAVTRGARVLDWSDRYETAWGAVVEALFDDRRSEAPETRELWAAADDAIRKEVEDRLHHEGVARDGGRRPRFLLYWEVESTQSRPGVVRSPGNRADADFVDLIAERLSVHAMLRALTERERDVLIALAIHGSPKAARAALGLGATTYTNTLAQARWKCQQACLSDDETPLRVGKGATAAERRAGVCSNGHLRTEHSYRDAKGVLMCRLCKRNSARRYRARQRT